MCLTGEQLRKEKGSRMKMSTCTNDKCFVHERQVAKIKYIIQYLYIVEVRNFLVKCCNGNSNDVKIASLEKRWSAHRFCAEQTNKLCCNDLTDGPN